MAMLVGCLESKQPLFWMSGIAGLQVYLNLYERINFSILFPNNIKPWNIITAKQAPVPSPPPIPLKTKADAIKIQV